MTLKDRVVEDKVFDDLSEDVRLNERLGKKYDVTRALTKPFEEFIGTEKMEQTLFDFAIKERQKLGIEQMKNSNIVSLVKKDYRDKVKNLNEQHQEKEPNITLKQYKSVDSRRTPQAKDSILALKRLGTMQTNESQHGDRKLCHNSIENLNVQNHQR